MLSRDGAYVISEGLIVQALVEPHGSAASRRNEPLHFTLDTDGLLTLLDKQGL